MAQPALSTTDPASERLPRQGFFLLASLALFWGTNWPAMKLAVQDMDPWTFRAICFVAGAGGLMLVARARGLSLRIPRGDLGPLILTAFINVTCWQVFSAFGLTLMAAGRASIIAFTMPVWAALLAIPLLGERPGGRQVVGLALGLGGLLVLLGPEALRGGAGDLSGPFLVVAAAVSWALGTVLMKRRGIWRSHAAVVTGWQYALSAVPVIVLAAVLESAPGPASWHLPTWLALGYHLVFSICIAQILWFVIVRRLTMAQSTIATLLIPVVGVAGSILVLGDPLSARVLAALALVVSAVACVMVRRRRSD